MSERNMKDASEQPSDQKTLEPGTILQVVHSFSKTRDDELDLVPGDLITVLECPEGGWCKGIKGIDSKTPITGWFPIVVSKEYLPANQLEIEQGHKRSRSASIFGRAKSKTVKSLEGDEKIKRTRSTSAPVPAPGISTQSLLVSNDLDTVVDLSIVSLNLMSPATESPSPRGPESKPILSLRGSSFSQSPLKGSSFFQSPTREYMALKELADTEWHYLQDLYLMRHCRKVISKLLALSDKAVKTVFGNLDQLIRLHELLNDDLEILIVQGSQSAVQLSNIFGSRMEDFLVYVEYGNNYQSGQDKLKKLGKKVNTRDVLKRISSQSRSRNLGLESFLIAPVQRICKYPLLLKQIIKDFESDGRDTTSLKDTLINMEKIMTLINDSMKQSSTKRPSKSSKKSYEKAGCTMLKEEKIMIHLDKKNKKKGYIYLFNDSIVVAKRSWGGKWSTILDVYIADPSFAVAQGEKGSDLQLIVKNASLQISFKSTAGQQSFKKTYSSLLESCKNSKNSVAFDAVFALEGFADASDDESDFSDDGSFSGSSLSIDIGTPRLGPSMIELDHSIFSADTSPPKGVLDIELKDSPQKIDILLEENKAHVTQNESLKEALDNLEAERNTLIDQITTLQDTNETLKSKVAEVETQYENLKIDTANILAETEECNSALQEEIAFYKDIQDRFKIVSMKAEQLEEKNSSLQSEKMLLELSVESIQSDLSKLQQELQNMTENNQKLITEAETNRFSVQGLSSEVKSLTDEKNRLINAQNIFLQNVSTILAVDSEQHFDSIFNIIYNQGKHKAQLETDFENLRKSTDEIQQKLDDLNKRMNAENEISLKKDENISDYEQRIASLDSFIESLQGLLGVQSDDKRSENLLTITQKIGRLVQLENEYLQLKTEYENSVTLQEKLNQDICNNKSELEAKKEQLIVFSQFKEKYETILAEKEALEDLNLGLRNQISDLQSHLAFSTRKLEELQAETRDSMSNKGAELEQISQELQNKISEYCLLQQKSNEQRDLVSQLTSENERLKLQDREVLATYKSLLDRLSALLSVECIEDNCQQAKSIDMKIQHLKAEFQTLQDENSNLKEQLADKLNVLRMEKENTSNLNLEKSALESKLQSKEEELKNQEEISRKHLTELSAENDELQKNYRDLQSSKKIMIESISSFLDITLLQDQMELMKIIEEKCKRLLKYEYDFKSMEKLCHEAMTENNQLSLELKDLKRAAYAKEDSNSIQDSKETISIKQDYISLQERFNLLLNDLHNNQARFFTMEKELGRKNAKLKDLDIKLQAAVNEIHQLKAGMKEQERMLTEENLILKAQLQAFKGQDSDKKVEHNQQNTPDFYFSMISKLEKEMFENKNQLIESKETLKAELKSIQAQYERRGYCLRKLYGQLQEAFSEREKLHKIQNQATQEIQSLRTDKSVLIVEREALKKQIEMVLKEKSLFGQQHTMYHNERPDPIYKEPITSKLNLEKEATVWKTLFFEIEVILGLSSRKKKILPTLDEEARVANIVSKIRSIVKEIKEVSAKSEESQDTITKMAESLRANDVRINELLLSITEMAQEIKLKTSDFEHQIHEKNIMISDLVKDKASEQALQALKVVKQERLNYEIRLRDANSLIRKLSVEISVLKAELEKNEKTISDQEIMISDFCIQTQRLQSQIKRLQERLEQAQALEADHIFELDKLEKKLSREIEKNKKGLMKSEQSISLNSAETLHSGHSINYRKASFGASSTLVEVPERPL